MNGAPSSNRSTVLLWLAALTLATAALAWSGARAWHAHEQRAATHAALRQVEQSLHRIAAAQRSLTPLAFRARPELSGAAATDDRARSGTRSASSPPPPRAQAAPRVTDADELSAVEAQEQATSLAARMAEVLRAAGAPAQTLTSLQPDGESVLAQSGAASSSASARSIASGSSGAASLVDARAVQVKRVQAVAVLEGLTLPQLGKVFEALRRREPDWRVASIDLCPMPVGKNSAVAQRGGDAPLRAVLTLQSEYLTPPLPPPAPLPQMTQDLNAAPLTQATTKP